MAEVEHYEIKRVEFLARKVPILMQSKNGPCPLLAIANQLLLVNAISLPDFQEDITLNNLVSIVAGKLIDSNPIDEASPDAENKRKALDDVIQILPSLGSGLDVNVQFSGVDKFEFDRNIAIFDMLGIALYHGWVIDPQDEVFRSLITLAYNTLIERVVNYDVKFGNDEAKIAEAMDDPVLGQLVVDGELAQRFLSSSASQLTYPGLAMLHEKVKEREVCVFFRNNHFSTMYKHEGQLYLLCTDAGFKARSAVAWERLSDINGDTELCSPTFGDPNAFLSAEDAFQEVTADAALARQLQYEDEMHNGNAGGVVNYPELASRQIPIDSETQVQINLDAQIAMELANQDYAQQQQPRQPAAAGRQPTAAAKPKEKKDSGWNCCIS
jgi:hypothetical protein